MLKSLHAPTLWVVIHPTTLFSKNQNSHISLIHIHRQAGPSRSTSLRRVPPRCAPTAAYTSQTCILHTGVHLTHKRVHYGRPSHECASHGRAPHERCISWACI